MAQNESSDKPAGGAEGLGDFDLRSPASEREGSRSRLLDAAPLSPRSSRVEEAARAPRRPALIYEPLEAQPGNPAAAPPAGPDPADGAPLLFRLALGTAAFLVLLVFVWGYWWPHRRPPERASILPAAEPTPIEESVRPAPQPRQAEPAATTTAPPKPAPAKPARKPEPKKVAAPVEKPKPTTKPKPVIEAAAEPASEPPARRLPQPWEEGPQPPDLLKPGPGVEQPVPLEIPRYSYPAAARGTGLQADVRVAVLVDEQGRVIEARIREGAPPGLGFAETALAVAKRIPFQPATRYDLPGKMWTEVILEFAE
jgi:TonB family protein